MQFLSGKGQEFCQLTENAQADIKFYQTKNLHTTFGVEESILAGPLTSYLDTTSAILSYEAVNNSLPSFVLSQRGEGEWGHFHFGLAFNSVTLRDFSTKVVGSGQLINKDYTVKAWAVNASGSINMPWGQLLQYYASYDQGLTDILCRLEWFFRVRLIGE